MRKLGRSRIQTAELDLLIKIWKNITEPKINAEVRRNPRAVSSL